MAGDGLNRDRRSFLRGRPAGGPAPRLVRKQFWLRDGHDPFVKTGEGMRFYGNPDGKTNVFAFP